MTDDERTVIICARSEGFDDPVGGSLLEHCVDCGHEVWLSPSGQEIVADTAAEFLCTVCGIAMVDRDPDPQIQPLTQAQRIEITRALGRRMEPPV